MIYAVHSKVVFKLLVLTFRLSIGLRIERSAYLAVDIENVVERLLVLACEHCSSIGDDGAGRSCFKHYVFVEKGS